jgi:hypothetical protein
VGSDNPSGADNQQERPCSSNWLDRIPSDLGNWVAGFVDGEGSFKSQSVESIVSSSQKAELGILRDHMQSSLFEAEG